MHLEDAFGIACTLHGCREQYPMNNASCSSRIRVSVSGELSSGSWRSAIHTIDRHEPLNQKLRRWNGYPGTEIRRRSSPAKRPEKLTAVPDSYACATDRT